MPEIRTLKTSDRKLGRLHTRNNRNKSNTVRQIMHITRINEDSMKIKLVAYHVFTTGQLKIAIYTTIELLNEYFDNNSQNSLGKRIMGTIETNPHFCFIIIEKQ